MRWTRNGEGRQSKYAAASKIAVGRGREIQARAFLNGYCRLAQSLYHIEFPQGQRRLRQRQLVVRLLAFHDVKKVLPCQSTFFVDSLYYRRQYVRGCFPRYPKHDIRLRALSLQHSKGRV
jgi:hypothetical protein